MSGFKRLCLFIFGLSGLLSLALLLAYTVPSLGYASTADELLADPIVGRVALGVVCITALGAAISLLRALFSPRNRRSVIIARDGADEIQVTRDAIKAQAVHVIERDGKFTAKSVAVRAKKRGHVRVFARVQPRNVVNVLEEGQRLHEELDRGLADICGDKVDSVKLEFVDAVSHDGQQGLEDFSYDLAAMPAFDATYTPAPESVTPEAPEPVHEEGITVPMGTTSWHPQEVGEQHVEAPTPSVDVEPEPEDDAAQNGEA